jgi:hypothetical protein
MSAVSNVGKIAYIYDENTDTWYPVAGMTDASANFSWTGNHSFSSSSNVRFSQSVVARSGINNFASVADRNTQIPNPTNGTLALVLVNGVMQVQFFNNGAWRLVGSNANLDEKSTSYSLQLADAGRTIVMNSASANVVTIPLDSQVNFPVGAQMAFIQKGAGQTSFVPGTDGSTSVTIHSKNSNRKLSARYTQAIIVKDAANTWILMGDLTA